MKPLVIYHAGCRDGFCAAWIAHRYLPDAEFHPGYYGHAPPDVTGRDVYILEFSYDRPDMVGLAARAKTFTVLDHHKTAVAT